MKANSIISTMLISIVMILLLFLNSCDQTDFPGSLFGPKKNQSFMEFCQSPSKPHKILLKKLIHFNSAKKHLNLPFQYNNQSCKELYSFLKEKPDISIKIPKKIPNIDFIKEFNQLEKLYLEIEEGNLDYSCLEELTLLKDLKIWAEVKIDLKFLDNINNLERFSLSAKKQSKIYNFNLDKLKFFKLYSGRIADISFLKNSKNLEEIDVSNNNVKDLSPISELYNLKSINIYHNKIEDICPIKNLTNLEYLGLRYNKITKICALKRLKKLTRLDLSFNKISNISSFQGMDHLEHLSISKNKLTDIAPLQNLKNLKYIDVAANQVVDITPLSNLTEVSNLLIDRNNIKNIVSLKSLKNLEFLHIEENQIEDISVVQSLPKIRSVGFYENPIKDYTPVLRFIRKEVLDFECTESDLEQGHCTEQQYRIRMAKKRLEVEHLIDAYKDNSN